MSVTLDRALLKALDRVDQGAWSDRVLAASLAEQGAGSHPAAFVARFRGVLEVRRDLDARLAARLRRPPQGIVLQALRLGLHDLDCGKPPHAVLNRLQNALGSAGKGGRSLVNGVLRAMLREGETPRNAPPQAEALLPAWLLDLLRRHPDPTPPAEKAAGLLARRPSWFRLRTGRDPVPGAVSDGFSGRWIHFPHLPPEGLAGLPAFQEGALVPQDLSAWGSLSLLDAPAGARVLDACAAPGGKSLALLDQHPDLRLDCAEADPARARSLERRLPEDLPVYSGRLEELAANGTLRPVYDRILLDAPCGGSGSVGLRPEIALRDTDPVGPELLARQASLLRCAAGLLAPGGVIVYSTCSLDPRENKLQLASFLEEQAFSVESALVPQACRDENGAWAWLPWKQRDCGGAWAVALRKEGP